jgi:hypothetical protein
VRDSTIAFAIKLPRDNCLAELAPLEPERARRAGENHLARGPITAMNDVLLFWWSTALIFEVLRRTLARRIDIQE